MGQFNIHGIYTLSNSIMFEVEISNSGDEARLRHYHSVTGEPEMTGWLPIETIPAENRKEEDGAELITVIDPQGYQIPLNLVMRIT